MSLKNFFKKSNILRRVVKKIKIWKEFFIDYCDFKKYYNDSGYDTIEMVEYKILLLVHSLEKGMCHEKIRLFGEKKIVELIEFLNLFKLKSNNFNSTPFIMGCSIIRKWLEVFDANNFQKDDIYILAHNFIDNCDSFKNVDVGSFTYNIFDYKDQFKFDYNSFISSRHSVRNYLSKPISNEDIDYCINSALLSPTACNRQMVKIYYIKDKNKKNILNNYLMGLSGFEKDNINYFVVTFDISAFSFYGERNQGYFNSGLVAMNFVNALHSRKIGSCFLQWGNTNKEEKKIKAILEIPNSQKISVVIAAGYYKDESVVPVSHRKRKSEIFKKL